MAPLADAAPSIDSEQTNTDDTNTDDTDTDHDALSDTDAASDQPPAAPTAAEKPRKTRPPRSRLVVIGVLVVLLGAGGYAVKHTTASRGVTISYPSSWDPRVTELVSYVEAQRGLRFKHAVAVDFLTPSEYHKVMTTDSSTLSSGDKRDIDRQAGLLRAVGLVSGKVDLLGASNTLADDGTLAVYDPTHKRVRIRGSEMTPGLRVTLVHELTHAAQDQYFDIGRNLDSDSGSTAFRALVEGDAQRIENRYILDMSDQDQQAYDDELNTSEPDETVLADVPPALTAFFAAPYTLGAELVAVLDDTGGNKRVDEAMQTPPTNDVQLLDPFRFLTHELAATVATPKLDKGDKVLDDSDFGALMLYFMLSGRIDQREALRAADAWDGDASLAYEHKGRPCVRVHINARTDEGADRLLSALTAWSKMVPAADPVVNRTVKTVNFQSCDPGEAAAAPSGNGVSADALVLPASRIELARTVMQQQAGPELARCVAGKLIDLLSLEQLSDPNPDHLDAAAVAHIRDAGASCEAAVEGGA